MSAPIRAPSLTTQNAVSAAPTRGREASADESNLADRLHPSTIAAAKVRCQAAVRNASDPSAPPLHYAEIRSSRPEGRTLAGDEEPRDVA